MAYRNSSGMGGQSSRGLAASAFAAAAARAVALSQAGADGGLPMLTSGGLGFSSNMTPADVRGGLSSRDGPGPSRYAAPTARSSFGSNAGMRSGGATAQTTARTSLAGSEQATPRLLF